MRTRLRKTQNDSSSTNHSQSQARAHTHNTARRAGRVLSPSFAFPTSRPWRAEKSGGGPDRCPRAQYPARPKPCSPRPRKISTRNRTLYGRHLADTAACQLGLEVTRLPASAESESAGRCAGRGLRLAALRCCGRKT